VLALVLGFGLGDKEEGPVHTNKGILTTSDFSFSLCTWSTCKHSNKFTYYIDGQRCQQQSNDAEPNLIVIVFGSDPVWLLVAETTLRTMWYLQRNDMKTAGGCHWCGAIQLQICYSSFISLLRLVTSGPVNSNKLNVIFHCIVHVYTYCFNYTCSLDNVILTVHHYINVVQVLLVSLCIQSSRLQRHYRSSQQQNYLMFK